MIFPSDEIGFLGIETPASVKRKVDDLLANFKKLAESYPDDPLVKSELEAYQKWASDVNSSVFNRLFASGIAPKFEEFQRRYATAFETAKKKAPNIEPIAPLPTDVIVPQKTSIWLYALIGGSVSLGLYAIAKLKK